MCGSERTLRGELAASPDSRRVECRAAMFSKVLVANRGEIADPRHPRAARSWASPASAVYSELDRDALHVARADEAYLLGRRPGGRELPERREDPRGRAASPAPRRSTRATASWPRTPPSRARARRRASRSSARPRRRSRRWAPRRAARELMEKAGVPIVAGHDRAGAPTSRPRARSSTTTSAIPVAVKAAGGGGGKGFRVALAEDELEEAFEGAAREGEKFFSDATVYLERYLPDPRHVEVQVLADTPRQRHPPRRARLLGPAPPPEADRGVAGARGRRGAARAHRQDRHRRRARRRLRRRRHHRGPARRTASTSSWR